MSVADSPSCRRTPADVLGNATLVPIDLIVDAPGQPREQLPDVDVLAANIAQLGLLQPVALRRNSGRYEVISGHRRVAAFRRLRAQHPFDPQWTAISAVVTRVDDATAHLSLLSAQLLIEGWTAAEERQVMQRLVDMGMTLREIGVVLHRTESWVSKRWRAYSDEALGPHVMASSLAPTVAEELLSVPEPAQRRVLGERAASEHWSQSRARAEVRSLRSERRSSPAVTTRFGVRAVVHRTECLLSTLQQLEPHEITPTGLTKLLQLAALIEKRFKPARARRLAGVVAAA